MKLPLLLGIPLQKKPTHFPHVSVALVPFPHRRSSARHRWDMFVFGDGFRQGVVEVNGRSYAFKKKRNHWDASNDSLREIRLTWLFWKKNSPKFKEVYDDAVLGV